MTRQLDMDKIAKGLGAERRGKVSATGGYFASLQLVAEVQERLRVPQGGGPATDRNWTERRLIPLKPRTLQRLEKLAARIRRDGKVSLDPMQLAGLLLERSAEELDDNDAERLLSAKGGSTTS